MPLAPPPASEPVVVAQTPAPPAAPTALVPQSIHGAFIRILSAWPGHAHFIASDSSGVLSINDAATGIGHRRARLLRYGIDGAILDTIADVDASGLWPGKVVTEVVPAGPFWEAEPEHQDYLERYPAGYTCHFVRPDWKLPRRAANAARIPVPVPRSITRSPAWT